MANDKQTHDGASRMVDKAQDAVGAAVGKASASMGGGTDTGFVKNAVLSNLYEIKAAEVAKRRTSDASVSDLAEQMIKDHTHAASELKSVLASLSDVDAPAEELDERRNGMIDNLEAAPGEAFDKTYLDQQYAAHDEAITLFRNYAENGDQPKLRSFASSTLPVLERHFDHVKKLRNAS